MKMNMQKNNNKEKKNEHASLTQNIKPINTYIQLSELLIKSFLDITSIISVTPDLPLTVYFLMFGPTTRRLKYFFDNK